MMRRFTLLALLACCSLPGCASLDLFRLTRSVRSHSGDSTFDFEITDSGVKRSDSGIKVMQEAARIDHDFLVQQIVKTRPGSQVALNDNSDLRYVGTVLSASRSGIELMNCICKEVVPGPDGQMQCKTSHIPSWYLSTDDVTHYIVIAPPSREFADVAISRSKNHVTVDSIVFMSGRRIRCPLLPVREDPGQHQSSFEEIRSTVQSAQIGSQVCVVDQSSHPHVGTLHSIEPDGVKLVHCIDTEMVTDPNGRPQPKTNLVPFRTFPMKSISSFRVISSPATESDPSTIGEDSADYCFAEFIFKSGLRQSWGKPPGPAASE